MGIIKVIKETFVPQIIKTHKAALSINESRRRNEWRSVTMKEYKNKYVIEIRDKDSLLIHSEKVNDRRGAIKIFENFQLNLFTKIVAKVL